MFVLDLDGRQEQLSWLSSKGVGTKTELCVPAQNAFQNASHAVLGCILLHTRRNNLHNERCIYERCGSGNQGSLEGLCTCACCGPQLWFCCAEKRHVTRHTPRLSQPGAALLPSPPPASTRQRPRLLLVLLSPLTREDGLAASGCQKVRIPAPARAPWCILGRERLQREWVLVWVQREWVRGCLRCCL